MALRPFKLLPEGPRTYPKPSRTIELPIPVTTAVHTLETTLGGRQYLIDTIASAPRTERLDELLAIIADPANTQTDLALLCARTGIDPSDLFEAVKAATVVRGQVCALIEASKAVQEATRQLAAAAVAHDEPCQACNGVGTTVPEPTRANPNPGPQPCRTCNGRGQVHVPADFERQKTLLEILQLLKKSGVNIVNAQSVTVPGGPVPASARPTLEFSDAIQQALYGKKAAPPEPPIEIEATPVNPEPEPEDPA